jgi:hypothetical protein
MVRISEENCPKPLLTCYFPVTTKNQIAVLSKLHNFEGAKGTQKCGLLHPRMSGENRRKPLILIGVPDGI